MLGIAAHQGRQLFVDDLHDHLRRGQGLQHVAADALFRNGLGEILDHLVADVRLQQRHPDLPHGLLDVGFLQAALAPELFKGCGNFFG